MVIHLILGYNGKTRMCVSSADGRAFHVCSDTTYTRSYVQYTETKCPCALISMYSVLRTMPGVNIYPTGNNEWKVVADAERQYVECSTMSTDEKNTINKSSIYNRLMSKVLLHCEAVNKMPRFFTVEPNRGVVFIFPRRDGAQHLSVPVV